MTLSGLKKRKGTRYFEQVPAMPGTHLVSLWKWQGELRGIYTVELWGCEDYYPADSANAELLESNTYESEPC